MDPDTLITGAVILGAGQLTGYRLGWRAHRRRTKHPKPAKPICGCEHSYGEHINGGQCQGQRKQATRWDAFGSYATHWKWIPCPCVEYDGPEPLPRSWHPPSVVDQLISEGDRPQQLPGTEPEKE